MKRMPVFVLGLSVLLIGCPSVHTMRSAEVLPSGQSENVVHVGQNGLLITAEATAEGETEGGSAAGVIPWAAYSYRAGLGNNLDFQVKVDMGLFPELGLGYQFVGTPGQGGTAVSAYVGTKYIGAGAGESQFSLVYAPVVLLADLPLGGSQVTVKGGFMVISASGNDDQTVATQPLLGLSGRIKLGGMTLLPEVSYMHGGSETASSSDGSTSASVGAGLIAYGVGFSF